MSKQNINYDVMQAFYNNKTLSRCNTQVTTNKEIFLHGHKILWKNKSNNICFSLCGYNTQTTKARLNNFVSIYQRKGELFVNLFNETHNICKYSSYEINLKKGEINKID